ncbi:MAG: ankyrin repeat domain-containing protein [Sulfuricaulis sp.]
MKPLFDLPFDDALTAFFSEPEGQRFRKKFYDEKGHSAFAGMATCIAAPAMVAAAIHHAGLAGSRRKIRVGIITGHVFDLPDQGKWLSFTHKFAGLPTAVHFDVRRTLEHGTREWSPLRDYLEAIPAPRIRNIDPDHFASLWRSATNAVDLVILSAELAIESFDGRAQLNIPPVAALLPEQVPTYLASDWVTPLMGCEAPLKARGFETAAWVPVRLLSALWCDRERAFASEYIPPCIARVARSETTEPSEQSLLAWKITSSQIINNIDSDYLSLMTNLGRDSDVTGLPPRDPPFSHFPKHAVLLLHQPRTFIDTSSAEIFSATTDGTKKIQRFENERERIRETALRHPGIPDRFPADLDATIAYLRSLGRWNVELSQVMTTAGLKHNQDKLERASKRAAQIASIGLVLPPPPEAMPQPTALWRAVVTRHRGMAISLAQRGAAVNYRRQSDGRTPLTYSLHGGSGVIAADLLSTMDADVNAVDGYGWTALAYAASNGHDELVPLLLDQGARLDHELATGITVETLIQHIAPNLLHADADSNDDESQEAGEEGPASEPDITPLEHPSISTSSTEPSVQDLEQTVAPVLPAPPACVLATQVTIGALHDVRSGQLRLEAAREIVQAWASKKLSSGLDGRSWHAKTDAVAVDADGDESLWAMVLDDTHTPGQTWRVEMILAAKDESAHLGMRVLRRFNSQANDHIDQRHPVSIPRIMRDLVNSVGVRDAGIPMRSTPWAVNRDEVVTLAKLIQSPLRQAPVLIVVGGAIGHSATKGTGTACVPATILAEQLAGIAHVVDIDPEAAYPLGRIIGLPLMVQGQGFARVYRPAVRVDDPRQRNPVIVPRDNQDTRALRQAALRAVLRTTAAADDETVPSAASVLATIARRRSDIQVALTEERAIQGPAPATTAAEQEPLPPESSATATAATQAPASPQVQLPATSPEQVTADPRIAELESLLRSLKAERDRMETARQEDAAKIQELLERNRDLQSANDDLRGEVREVRTKYRAATQWKRDTTEASTSTPPIPDTLDELDEWAEQHLDNVILSKRALRSAKESFYEDPKRVYRSLLLLDREYSSVVFGGNDADRERLNSSMSDIKIDISPVGKATDHHLYKNEYKVNHEGRTYELDRHVSSGNSHDERKTMRIYFAVDDDEMRLIVGHLPGHLTNRMT